MRTNLGPVYGRERKNDLYCNAGTFLAFYLTVFVTTQPPGSQCDVCVISSAMYMGAPQARTRFEQLDFCNGYVSFSCPLAE